MDSILRDSSLTTLDTIRLKPLKHNHTKRQKAGRQSEESRILMCTLLNKNYYIEYILKKNYNNYVTC